MTARITFMMPPTTCSSQEEEAWGTECMMSKFGIPLVLANQSDGSVTLHPADWNGTGYIHIEKDKAMYTDNSHASHWTLEASGDGYVIKSDSATYVKPERRQFRVLSECC